MPRTPLWLTFLSVPLLLGGLARAQDDDPVLRGRKLSEWLGLLRGEQDQTYRSLSLLALGGTGDHSVALALARSRRAGLSAVVLIGPTKSRKVLPAIVAALRDDPHELVRVGAAEALGRLGPRPKDTRPPIRFTDAREALVAALRTDKVGAVREAAATALGQIDPNEVGSTAVQALAAALKDPHVGTSNAAAETLRKLGREAKQAVANLQQVVKDKAADPLTRIPAAQALGKIGPPEAVAALPVLKEVLTDIKAPIDSRRSAAESISKLGKDAPDVIPLLAMLLTTDASVEVRRAVAAALDEFGTEARSTLPSLLKAFKDDDKFVRCLAMHAVGQMGKELGSDTKEVVTALLKGLDDRVIEVRVAVLETFGNLGEDALGADAKVVVERVTALSKDSQKDIRQAAENALQKLKGM